VIITRIYEIFGLKMAKTIEPENQMIFGNSAEAPATIKKQQYCCTVKKIIDATAFNTDIGSKPHQSFYQFPRQIILFEKGCKLP
jgi:hypothetical protein